MAAWKTFKPILQRCYFWLFHYGDSVAEVEECIDSLVRRIEGYRGGI